MSQSVPRADDGGAGTTDHGGNRGGLAACASEELPRTRRRAFGEFSCAAEHTDRGGGDTASASRTKSPTNHGADGGVPCATSRGRNRRDGPDHSPRANIGV